jgi:hypothetical protein
MDGFDGWRNAAPTRSERGTRTNIAYFPASGGSARCL